MCAQAIYLLLTKVGQWWWTKREQSQRRKQGATRTSSGSCASFEAVLERSESEFGKRDPGGMAGQARPGSR